MKKNILLLVLFMACATSFAAKRTFRLERYGVVPNTHADMAPVMAKALAAIQAEADGADSIVLVLKRGRYEFHPTNATTREYYISNHDQDNPKRVGICLENWKNTTLEGNGSDLIFHGRMLPVSLIDSENCSLRNLSIDFANPHITQVQVVENNPYNGTITYRPAEWTEWKVENERFVAYGEGWSHTPQAGIAFDNATRHILYRTSDINVGVWGARSNADGTVTANWNDSRLTPGTIVAMRTYGRPTPGIFMYKDKRTALRNVTVHYAEGMGLLAQMCTDIDMNGFNVCLRGDKDPRRFTTQADATHFSGCRGHISSVGGLYEGMMDDAINIHGTYLKVVGRDGDRTLTGRYMHGQTYGFDWGTVGDTVQFVSSRTMDILPEKNIVKSIETLNDKEFRIVFSKPVPADITPEGSFGIENLTWTPTVYFAHNTVRNNRARGALFSTPRHTVCEDNLFDHTSGTAVLLCGDCNGWFETGACRDITIRRNRFVNALTNMFQFTNAVISIYPEIPDLEHQRQAFHSGIVIEDNDFDTFDYPLLYAKSVKGLVFRNNRVRHNRDFPPFHHLRRPVTLEHVDDAVIEK